MNLCRCCYDEATGTWCGCEIQHEQDSLIIAEARDYMNGPRDMGASEGWSFHCSACQRPTYGTAYYYTD